MLLSIAYIVFGLIILVISADKFIDSASVIAINKRLSPLLIGMIIIGFGTSAPELLV